MRKRRLPALAELLLALLLVGGAALAVHRLAARPWIVLGPSMEPTLQAGDRVIVDLLTYRRRSPRVGEIVLLAGPADLPLVKRVVRGPLSGRSRGIGPLLDPTRPHEPAFWVEGDNRVLSLDSRRFGAVPRSRILGRVAWRYWPPAGFGSIAPPPIE